MWYVMYELKCVFGSGVYFIDCFCASNFTIKH